jgi:hypothetical protein
VQACSCVPRPAAPTARRGTRREPGVRAHPSAVLPSARAVASAV